MEVNKIVVNMNSNYINHKIASKIFSLYQGKIFSFQNKNYKRKKIIIFLKKIIIKELMNKHFFLVQGNNK